MRKGLKREAEKSIVKVYKFEGDGHLIFGKFWGGCNGLGI
jgi:hypothetical protein